MIPTLPQIKALEIIRQATADGERYCKEHGFTGQEIQLSGWEWLFIFCILIVGCAGILWMEWWLLYGKIPWRLLERTRQRAEARLDRAIYEDRHAPSRK